MFRLWKGQGDEYRLIWNGLVAAYTLRQLSDAKRAEVYQHYREIARRHRLDLDQDVSAEAEYDPFWLAVTLADLGIGPFMGPNSPKWYSVANPRKARARLFEQGMLEEVAIKVLSDIHQKHGILLSPDAIE